MERRDNPLKIVRLTIIAFVSLIIGLSLIGDARSQVRYEYRVQPEGSGPILIPCIIVDRFNFVCIEGTGEIFTDTALYGSPYRRGLYASPYRDVAGNQPALPLREPVPSVANASGSDAFAGRALLARTVFTAMRRSAATPRIILAHQKLASDGWVDRSYNKKGERCCDQGRDCFSLEPDRIEQAPGGVIITMDDGKRVFVRGEDIMPSEDGKWWLCYWNNQVKCVFAPYNGS